MRVESSCHSDDAPDTLPPLHDEECALMQAALPDQAQASWSHDLDSKLECGCCCMDVPFEKMVQCGDGHLFCFACLRRRIEESTFGSLPACGPLACMDMADCNKFIPWSEICRAIETELLLKFEHRQASDSLARSKLQGLVHCSFCGLACEVDPDIVDFVCPNKDCGKASCLKCKGASHKPFCCEEVEKPADTQIRNEVEELMSRSLIRECTTCKAQLVKDGGCNKLTCRCGSSICYVCRQPVKNYTHFCEHFRSAGESCRMCRKCGLWDKEDEVTIVQKAKKAALESKAKKSPAVLARAIGPAEELFISKRRKR